MSPSSALDITITVPILGQALPVEPLAARPIDDWTEPEMLAGELAVYISRSAPVDLLQQVRRHRFARREWARLAWQALWIDAVRDPSLQAPRYLADHWRRTGVVPYPHQLEAARRVITEMGGRAILADEVGLGKTIEAGLILKEYLLRGQVRNALILCPAALIWQWYQELKEKFLLPAGIQRNEFDWERGGILIASLDTAKRKPHCDILRHVPIDLLIIDEAHKLKNDRTHNYRFVQSLQKTFMLLLTATPVQNELRELYNLVHLASPGLLGTYRHFQRQFTLDRRTVRHPDALQERLGRVLIRNRRGPDTVELTPRKVESYVLEMLPAEADFYRELSQFFDSLPYNEDGSNALLGVGLGRVTLQREACSSGLACAVTLQRMAARHRNAPLAQEMLRLSRQAAALRDQAKLQKALALIAELDEQVIIFTEYKATQAWLLDALKRQGVPALEFSGDLSASRKEWTKELFRRYGRVLVSTESGGEGLNFQFCRNLINFDLPWNPMKMEQRIGRIHRLGQSRPVRIFNLTTRGTIEEHILYLLHEKIRLFEMAVGELDEILSALPDQLSWEDELSRILAEAKGPGDVQRRLDELTRRFEAARQARAERLSIDQFV